MINNDRVIFLAKNIQIFKTYVQSRILKIFTKKAMGIFFYLFYTLYITDMNNTKPTNYLIRRTRHIDFSLWSKPKKKLYSDLFELLDTRL